MGLGQTTPAAHPRPSAPLPASGQHDDLFPRRAVAIADGQLDRLLEACVAVAEFTLALLHDTCRLAGVQVRQVDDGITVMERLAG